jgi:hypothetical protein
LVLGEECNAAQGKELQRILDRMFNKIDNSLTENGKARIDPIRQTFRKFVADASFGKLVNPKIPRQTGQILDQRFRFFYFI